MILLYYIIFYCVSFCEQNPKSSRDFFFGLVFSVVVCAALFPALMFTLVKKIFIYFFFLFRSVREFDVCAHTITIKKRSKTKLRSPLAQKFNKAPKIKHKSLQIQRQQQRNNFNRTFTECYPATWYTGLYWAFVFALKICIHSLWRVQHSHSLWFSFCVDIFRFISTFFLVSSVFFQ